MRKMREKLFTLIIFLSIIPFSAMATSVYTDYEGEGGLSLKTTISTSSTDLVSHAIVGSGSCCNCEDCECDCGNDDYNGYQYLSNTPYLWSSDYAEVEEGCINLHQYVVDSTGNRVIITDTYTGLEGSGNATSIMATIPLNIYTYQYAIGSGNMWTYMTQTSKTNGELDFSTMFISGAVCGYGSVFLEGEQNAKQPYAVFDPFTMQVICYDGNGDVYSTLYANSTDFMNVSASVNVNDVNWFSSSGVEGAGEILIDVNTDRNITFDFGMVLG